MKSIINIAYKFRIYPTKEQVVFFAKHFGCVRFIYNHLLGTRRESYLNEKKKISGFECKRMISTLKKEKEYTWLKEVNSQSLQEAALNLEKSYSRFFKKINNAQYPRFKKKNSKQSFCVPQHFHINVQEEYILIPKLKTPIKTTFHRDLGNIKKLNSLTFSKTPSDEYYVCINVEEEIVHKKLIIRVEKESKAVGVDLGLKDFIVTSHGEKIKAPKYLRKSEKALKKSQKKVSKAVKGSKNREKKRKILAKKHERVKNQRKDFIHKISNKLVSKNQAIFLETLDVKNMIKNRHLSKSIADVGWGEFIRQLKYKSKLFGAIIIQIGKWEPTSKLCSTPSCSYKNNSLSLADRYWECPICKTIHDRDINAAKNIEIIGREAPELKPVEKKANVFSIKKIQAFSVKQESLVS